MITVQHRFLDHQISPKTETLIIGTFNPETADNDAEFFYGRRRNYLWRLLPTAFGKTDLKGASKQEKLDFIKEHRIDFTDLIEEIQVEEGQEANYYDGYIDNKVTRWKNIYISPQKNRAVKNKSYFYNCYGKEKEYYIENQG